MHSFVLFVSLITLLLVPTTGQAQSPNRAGLVIHFPDGRIETTCVEFSEDKITGADLLNRSGLPVLLDFGTGLGAKVCKIGETGCNYPNENCWCQCQGSPCNYWNYWQLRDGNWVYSPLGASARRLGDGEVDSWVWGVGEQPPPLVSLEEICQVEVDPFTPPLDTPTARPTLAQQPSPTVTSPASPLSPPTATGPVSPLPSPATTARPPASPTPAPNQKTLIPATSEESLASETPEADLPASPDGYVGLAGVLSAFGLIALTIWRRRKGV